MNDTITFNTPTDDSYTPIMKLSRDGLWIDPNIPVDEVVQRVLVALNDSIKLMIAAAVEDERQKFCAALRQIHDSYSLASNPHNLQMKGQS